MRDVAGAVARNGSTRVNGRSLSGLLAEGPDMSFRSYAAGRSVSAVE
jgi:hypothetical protein